MCNVHRMEYKKCVKINNDRETKQILTKQMERQRERNETKILIFSNYAAREHSHLELEQRAHLIMFNSFCGNFFSLSSHLCVDQHFHAIICPFGKPLRETATVSIHPKANQTLAFYLRSANERLEHWLPLAAYRECRQTGLRNTTTLMATNTCSEQGMGVFFVVLTALHSNIYEIRNKNA